MTRHKARTLCRNVPRLADSLLLRGGANCSISGMLAVQVDQREAEDGEYLLWVVMHRRLVEVLPRVNSSGSSWCMKIDSQKRRLLRKLNEGAAAAEKGPLARWLGRRAGEIIDELESAGVLVTVKAGRKTYVVAVWRWHEL